MTNKDELTSESAITDPKLISVNESTLDQWRKHIEQMSMTCKTFYLVSDTETTDKSVIEIETKLFNRVLEWGMVLCVADEKGFLKTVRDHEGKVIQLNEPLNPFIEPIKNKKQQACVKSIHPKSTEVHGITLEYLFGKKPGLYGRTQLPHTAPYFEMVFFALQRMFNFSAYNDGEIDVHLVFYNANFDIGFLNHEMELLDNPPIESYFIPIDAYRMAKSIPKNIMTDYKLDSLYAFGRQNYPDEIKEVERPYHASLIDSYVLIEAWNTIIRYRQGELITRVEDDDMQEDNKDNTETED